MWFRKKHTLITHSGSFHADDIFACATLQILLDRRKEGYTITRTRDPKVIEAGDFVFDVGGVHNPEICRFDHHQPGGAGERPNGIPYASFGLVWQKYGEELAGSRDIAMRIDQKLVQPIDANDVGVDLIDLKVNVAPYTIQSALYAFRPTWKEDPKRYDTEFKKRVSFAKEVLLREIKCMQDGAEAVVFVERAYDEAPDKRIIELEGNYPYQEVLEKHTEPLFVVSPKSDHTDWRVIAVRKEAFSFENKKDFPQSWRGKRDQELAEVSGVSDAVFCHNTGFLAVAKTREGALALAKRAVEV